MTSFMTGLLVFAVILAGLIVILRVIFPVPTTEGRPPSLAIPASLDTVLGQRMLEAQHKQPHESMYVVLSGGYDALGSRLQLARGAQQSIDAQYYIWHDDMSGLMLLDELYEAALRGVRVRLLLDDHGIPGMDDVISALNTVPNFEVRLFNPSPIRKPKWLGFVIDFGRMNRRMHNKSFIVDGAAAIVGGRNIGDEYFSVGDADFYIDMDVLATGPIVPETAAAFDLYWNSSSVHEVGKVIRKPTDLPQIVARLRQNHGSVKADAMAGRLMTTAEMFRRSQIEMQAAPITLVVDDPIKGRGLARHEQLMLSRLQSVVGAVEKSVTVVTAYFVPGKPGTKWLSDLARDKRVQILTNALDATDVLVVHAGYTKYRRALLKAGVELYELKRRDDKVSGKEELKPLGLSGSSLHAKTIVVDDRKVFVGSFNFDPRSALLNCEMGFLIQHEALAHRIKNEFSDQLARRSYRPVLTVDQRIAWLERDESDGQLLIYQGEPNATIAAQVSIATIQRLPVEWLL